MAGSSMVVVFVAVAILLSAKRKLLCVRVVRDIRLLLESVRIHDIIFYFPPHSTELAGMNSARD